jgi:vitamin B12 transporter
MYKYACLIILLIGAVSPAQQKNRPNNEVLMTSDSVDRWLKANPGKTRADIPKRYLNTAEINRWIKRHPGKSPSHIPGYMIPAVTTTATRTPRSPNNTGRSVTIIDERDIQTKSRATITELLRGQPGVDARTSIPGQSASLFIRGLASDQTKVMLDGIDVTDVSTPSAAPFLDPLPTFNLGRVEIVRGTASSLYGSGAIGGVINLIPAQPMESGIFGGYLMGSFGTRKAYAGMNFVSETATVTAGYQDLHTDGLSASSAGTEPDAFDSQTAMFRSRFSLSETFELDISAYNINSLVEFDNSTSDNLLNYTDSRQSFVRVAPRIYLGEGWTSTLNLTTGDQRRTTFSGGSLSYFRSKTYNIDWQNDLELGDDHLLTVGFVQRKETSDTDYPTFASFFDAKRSIRSVYVQDQIGFGPDEQGRNRVQLTPGIRMDDYSDFGSATTYTLAGNYDHHETGTAFHGSYGTGFKAPSLYQLFDSFGGNPNLVPEESRGWDAGIRQAFGPDLQVGVTHFQTDLENMIDYDTNTFAYVQRGSVTIRGYEVDATWRPTQRVHVRPHYTFTSAHDVNGDQLVRRPRHKAGVEVTAQLIEDVLRAQLSGNYTGKRNDVVPGSFPAATTRNKAYLTVDFSLAVKTSPHAEWLFGVTNLTNKEYEDVLGFTSPGRAYYVGLDLRF